MAHRVRRPRRGAFGLAGVLASGVGPVTAIAGNGSTDSRRSAGVGRSVPSMSVPFLAMTQMIPAIGADGLETLP